MRSLFIIPLLLACANETKIAEPSSEGTITQDADGDGFVAPEDCNDSDATIFPNADEVCDGTDNNCDGNIDEGVQTDFFADYDGDGFGDPAIVVQGCSEPDGFVSNGSDCNDREASAFPGGVEVCDSIDNDCNGTTDEGIGNEYLVDEDGDGFGSADNTIIACELRDGLTNLDGDCDDTNVQLNPLATEVCDEIDNNCDGNIDEGVQTTFYADADGDGFGDDLTSIQACALIEGYTVISGDCDDADTLVYNGAMETCDGKDNNCDGTTDEDTAMGAPLWYEDGDEDGFGNANSTTNACNQPNGYVSDSTDCNDNNDSISPSMVEQCNSVDDNCDGNIDEDGASDAPVWYEDGDEDGFGDPNSTLYACSQPSGYVADNTDCNDNNEDTSPVGVEICNNKDDNCDGQIDEQGGQFTFYIDSDNDGLGDPNFSEESCSQPTGYVSNNYDCDDGDDTSTSTTNDADCDGSMSAEDCDDTDPSVLGLGTASSCPAEHCSDLLDLQPNAQSGVYWISPQGSPFEAYCDMDTADGGWTMLFNLDTSDGHVMWWGNSLWTDSNTYGDVQTPFIEDHKSAAFSSLDEGSNILLVVHQNGQYVGWKRFEKNGSGTLLSYLTQSDNTLLGSSVVDSSISGIWTGERLVRDSTSLYANRCVQTGGACTSGNTGSPDGDRIGSMQGTISDNNGGGLGNWHDMNYCCGISNPGSGKVCNGYAFRTTSEAQAGWVYSGQNGTFGTDTLVPMTGTQSNSGCTSNWAVANGIDYDYALFFGQ